MSGPFEWEGLSFEIKIYRSAEEPQLDLEIVDEGVTSHVFDERFADETAAHACAVAAIEAGEVAPMREEEEALLSAYWWLRHPDVAPGLRESPMYIFGALTALHTTPSVVQFAEVFGEFFSGDRRFAEPVVEALANLHDIIGACLHTSIPLLDALESHEDATQWASGYLSVVERDPVWAQEANAADTELLAPILALAAVDGTEAPDDVETPGPGLLREALERTAADLYDRWRDLRTTLAAEQGAITFKRETPKVGRNEPCPCGSGKKYKKCCLRG